MATNGTFNSTGNDNATILDQIFGGAPADVKAQAGIQLKAFLLNLAVSFGLFAFQVTAFFLLKSSAIGRRI